MRGGGAWFQIVMSMRAQSFDHMAVGGSVEGVTSRAREKPRRWAREPTIASGGFGAGPAHSGGRKRRAATGRSNPWKYAVFGLVCLVRLG